MSESNDTEVPQFHCDAMLCGLTRWLRCAGYDAAFEHGIDDGELVARAFAAKSVLLSSDGPLFDRRLVRDGAVRALFVPRHAPVIEQTVFVLHAFGLTVREPRCMACGGGLREISASEISENEVAPGARTAFERFYRCARCSRVYWYGSHWERIARTRAEIVRRLTKGASDR